MRGKNTNKKRTSEEVRFWCLEPESNQRHEDFQSSALPTELSGQPDSLYNSRSEICLAFFSLFDSGIKYDPLNHFPKSKFLQRKEQNGANF